MLIWIFAITVLAISILAIGLLSSKKTSAAPVRVRVEDQKRK